MIGILPFDDSPPLNPGRDEAYDWLVRELSKPEYTAAKPSLIDRIATAIKEWFLSLVVPSGGTFAAWVPVIIVVLVVAAVVAAILIWGVPRRNRTRRQTAALFGDDDTRTAQELRAHARQAAQTEDWETAVLEIFRALARGLDERTLVTVLPGTTAGGFASSAASTFPSHAERLRSAASDFDSVRYLDARATAEQYETIARLDAEIASTTPRIQNVEVGAS